VFGEAGGGAVLDAGRAGARAADGSVCVRTIDESFVAGGGCELPGRGDGCGATCGPLDDGGATCGPLGTVDADGGRRGGSWMPVVGALRARARGGSGGRRRPHAWHTARSSLFSALQNGQKRIRAHEPYPMRVSR
jgi:hypothetical protein